MNIISRKTLCRHIYYSSVTEHFVHSVLNPARFQDLGLFTSVDMLENVVKTSVRIDTDY